MRDALSDFDIKEIYFLEEDIKKTISPITPEQQIKQLKKEVDNLRSELEKHTDKKWRSAFEFKSPGLDEFYIFLENNFIQNGSTIKSKEKKEVLIPQSFTGVYLTNRSYNSAYTIITSSKELKSQL